MMVHPSPHSCDWLRRGTSPALSVTSFALAPLVKVAFCEGATALSGPQFGHRTVNEVVHDVVLAWLRGMAISRPQPDRLRQEVRDTILKSDPARYDEFSIEALATLGPTSTTEPRHGFARRRRTARPPESSRRVTRRSIKHVAGPPQLMLDLAEAYYIEQPDPHDRWGGSAILEDGIRDFKHGLGLGFGVPGAAWYYGPFFRLLNTRPIETIGFINRMLDHAAKFRVQKCRVTAVSEKSQMNSRASALTCRSWASASSRR